MELVIRGGIILLRMLLFHCLRDVIDGMYDEESGEISVDVKRPLVMRALRRSSVRKKIAEYLFDISPSCSYTSEIAYHVKTTPSNVIGAIRGMGDRYRTDESLLNLDLVEEKKGGKNIKLYGLTPFGKEMMESLRKRM
jgi:predicted transcriptional regulator with HTH domain